MRPFNYLVAENLEAALAQYGEGGSTLKAGGIDLLDRMKEGITAPATVLSIDAIKDLAYIREDGGAIRIGCLTTLADIGRSELLAKRAAALHHAAGGAATPQVRERATIGGNLCQRPNCWYFRHMEFECLKKGGHTCFAPGGENQYHAVIGGGPCFIVHPSNTAPALVAMNAEFKVRNAKGERTIPAADFFVLPKENLQKENVLEAGEILTEVVIPKPPQQSAVIELREKQSFDWPMSIAAVARIDGKWNVCLGASAPKPWVSQPANAVLGSQDVTEALAQKAGEAAAGEVAPLEDNAYKAQLIKVAVKRALMRAAGLEMPS